MTTQNRQTNAKRVALIIAGLNLSMLLVSFVQSIGSSARFVEDTTPVSAIVYSVLAVLIISRQPRNPVGWLFLLVGFFSALGPFSGPLQKMETYIDYEPYYGLNVWVSHLAWIPAFMIPITLVLQFFPDGKLPTGRWWPVTVATVMGICGFAMSYAFHPWPWEPQGILDTDNPFGIVGSEEFFELLFNLSILAFAIGLIGSLIAVVVRFRRSQGIERVQMKWLAYTAVIGISSILLARIVLGFYNNSILNLTFLTADNPISDFIFLSLPILLAITISIAILRYRLFDIDIIIRRTLQYAILTGILALIYFGLVVTFQGLFSAVGKQQGGVFIVISTLIIAALFNPLRIRIQNYIDRRFYRKKYHAEKALAQFAAAARDEVDLDKLTAELLEVVQETIQPESVGLILLNDKAQPVK